MRKEYNQLLWQLRVYRGKYFWSLLKVNFHRCGICYLCILLVIVQCLMRILLQATKVAHKTCQLIKYLCWAGFAQRVSIDCYNSLLCRRFECDTVSWHIWFTFFVKGFNANYQEPHCIILTNIRQLRYARTWKYILHKKSVTGSKFKIIDYEHTGNAICSLCFDR